MTFPQIGLKPPTFVGGGSVLNKGKSCAQIAEFLYLDDDTIRGWHKGFIEGGWEALAFDGWQGGHSRLTVYQEGALCAWFEDRFCRSADEIRAHIAAKFDLRCPKK